MLSCPNEVVLRLKKNFNLSKNYILYLSKNGNIIAKFASIRVFNSDFGEGGERSPPMGGGESRGGNKSGRGGMARDADATILLLNCEYIMAL